MEAIPNNQVIGTAVFEISGGSLDFLPSAISQFQETYVLHLVAWNFFQGTKTSRSWIKRLWCSGHTGTTKASTSTKLLNFTTKLRKLSFPSSRRPGWHFRWALWRFERFESFEILPRLFFLFLHLLFGGPKLVCCCFFFGRGGAFQRQWSCDVVLRCSLWTFFLEGIVPMAGKISSKASWLSFVLGHFRKKSQHNVRGRIIKISFFNEKRFNWQSIKHWRVIPSQDNLRATELRLSLPFAEVRDGLGLQLSNSNFERIFAVQSEKTNSWEEMSQPEQG